MIRTATRNDVPALAALIRELAAYEGIIDEVEWDGIDTLAAAMFGPDAVPRAFVAEVDGDIVGMAIWHRTFSAFRGQAGIWLDNLYVRPGVRDRGVGEQLMAAILEVAEGGRIEGSVLDWNTAAVAFYRRFGAAPVAGRTVFRGLASQEPAGSSR